MQAITIDDSMSVGQIRDLADRFGNFNVKNLQKYQLPTTGGPSSAVSYQVVETEQAEPILDVFRGLAYGSDVTPRVVQVEVGPSATSQDATAIAAALEQQGFDSDPLTTGKPAAKGDVTVIRFGGRGRAAAGVLARWIDGKVQYVFDPKLPGARLHLDPGAGFAAVRTEALPADAVEIPSLDERDHHDGEGRPHDHHAARRRGGPDGRPHRRHDGRRSPSRDLHDGHRPGADRLGCSGEVRLSWPDTRCGSVRS